MTYHQVALRFWKNELAPYLVELTGIKDTDEETFYGRFYAILLAAASGCRSSELKRRGHQNCTMALEEWQARILHSGLRDVMDLIRESGESGRSKVLDLAREQASTMKNIREQRDPESMNAAVPPKKRVWLPVGTRIYARSANEFAVAEIVSAKPFGSRAKSGRMILILSGPGRGVVSGKFSPAYRYALRQVGEPVSGSNGWKEWKYDPEDVGRGHMSILAREIIDKGYTYRATKRNEELPEPSFPEPEFGDALQQVMATKLFSVEKYALQLADDRFERKVVRERQRQREELREAMVKLDEPSAPSVTPQPDAVVCEKTPSKLPPTDRAAQLKEMRRTFISAIVDVVQSAMDFTDMSLEQWQEGEITGAELGETTSAMEPFVRLKAWLESVPVADLEVKKSSETA